MSATGVLLTYEKQITAWADNRRFDIAVPADGQRRSADAIVNAARTAAPEAAATTLTVFADPERAAAVGFGGRVVYVDPYTAQVLGEGPSQPRAFFRRMTEWHRWLGASAEGRTTARAITGASNLAFLILVLTGAYLWIPRSAAWAQVRNVIWFRRGLPAKARDFNWHNTIGVWSLIPLIVVVASGVVMSYPWANDLVYRLAGETPPSAASPARATAPAAVAPRASAGIQPPSVDAALARGMAQVAGWRSISLRLPPPGARVATMTIDSGNGAQPQKRGTLTMDVASAEVVRWEPFTALTPGRRLRSYVRFGHTGEAWGVAGQTIAGLASFGGVVLVVTGTSLALRRFGAWRARRGRDADTAQARRVA